MRLIVITVVTLLAGWVLAQEVEEVRHPAARKALIRAEQETRKAEQAYQQELLRIQQALIEELEEAKADAMRREQLDEANAIQAAINAATQELDQLEGKPIVQTFTIDASAPRTPTITVNQGDRIAIRASGRWSHSPRDRQGYGPDGVGRVGSDLGTLQGRIGDGPAFLIGSGIEFTADVDGTLYLFMRDSTPSDNQGAVRAVIGKQ